MSFDNNAAPTPTRGGAEDRWRIQDDLDLQDNPEFAERLAEYIDLRIDEAASEVQE